MDPSPYFPNPGLLEDLVHESVSASPAIRRCILECPALNTIDSSALEGIEAINYRLKEGGITFHLSEVKGPIMDQLKWSHFLEELVGKVYLRHYDAVASIKAELARRTVEASGNSPKGAEGVRTV